MSDKVKCSLDPSALARRTVLAAALALPLTARAQPKERLLHSDDFRHGLTQWEVQCERGGKITAANGVLDIDVPAGATLWFRSKLTGPIAIDYSVMPVWSEGPNDRVSDVNCFWMATDPAVQDGNALARGRSGAFADYDDLHTYYASVGGNGNTTTRFRRYIASPGNRPLLPQHDLQSAASLLQPNRPLQIRLIADGSRIAMLRDGRQLFALDDSAPYCEGHFAIRTTKSHLQVRDLRVWQLNPPE